MTDDQRLRRLYDGDRPDDSRTAFQRDRDRILYTGAFRRLAGVSQVASASEGHHIHNRLTHTLEVAQIARRLAEKLIVEQEALLPVIGGLDADVAEAAALAHDLGHPPFGHIGEQAIDRRVVLKGGPDDADGYEGNAQALRIVTQLATRHTDFRGLNLTVATLNAIIKYPWPRHATGKRHDKFGYYSTEKAIYDDLRSGYRTGFRTAEAELMDWADEVAYAVHDLYDFARTGLIPLDRLCSDQAFFKSFVAAVKARWETLKFERDYEIEEMLATWEMLRICILDGSYSGSHAERAMLRGYTSTLIGYYVKQIKLVDPADNDGKCVVTNRQAKIDLDVLKEFTWHYVINNPALATIQYGQTKILEGLFDCFFEDLKSERPALAPTWAKELREDFSPARVAADLVSGLTEQQAMQMHNRLTGIDYGTLADPIVR